MTIKIEKGIPAPLDAVTLSHEIKGMVPGDSFFIANCTGNMRGAYTRAASVLPGFLMVSAKATVKLGDAEISGLRFWRVEAKTVRKYEPKAPDKP